MKYKIEKVIDNGYTYYKIIDTENNNRCEGCTESYTIAMDFCAWLESNFNMPIYYNGKKL
jgi:hypothetical protein